MANSRTKPRAKSSTTPSKTASSAASAARVDRGRIAAMLAELPVLTDVQRAAFNAQFDDDRCRALGATTRAAVVELEAMRFARGAHGYLRSAPAGAVRYSPARLAWLVECLGRLVASRDADVSTRAKTLAKQRGRSLAEERAAVLLGELSLSLQDVAVGDTERSRELADARALVTPAEDPAAGLDAVAGVLERWLGSRDPKLLALLGGYGLGAGDASSARATAAALRAERDAAQGAGNAKVDGPAVNALEGRVLYEMRLLRKLFHRAGDRSSDPAIPRFNASPSLRRVFRNDGSRDDGSPDTPAPPTPQD